MSDHSGRGGIYEGPDGTPLYGDGREVDSVDTSKWRDKPATTVHGTGSGEAKDWFESMPSLSDVPTPPASQKLAACPLHSEFQKSCDTCDETRKINESVHASHTVTLTRDEELDELATYIALRLPEYLPLRGDRAEAKRVILALLRAAERR